METKLVRIAEISATSKHPIFTSVYHLINEDMLKQCHKELDGSKAVGIDKVTKDEYGMDLDRNIKDLVQRLKNKSFKPLPSLRVYIPKANGKKRPLGIASYEDKIVQMAVKKILWLIRKYLKAGIMEQGKFEPTEEGSAQGSIMSPILANIYMHHVLTLWFKLVVQREMQRESFLVNFADDFVAGFQYKSEAERYYKELKERMEKFGLELESSKSRLIEFGRFAEKNRRAKGERKPETFDFLGFIIKRGEYVMNDNIKSIKRWLFLMIGLLIMAFGVSFSIKGNLGTSPISSLPYVTGQISGLTVGTTTIIMHCVLILLQILILREKYDWIQLLQLPIAFLFGFMTDLAVEALAFFNPANYVQQWLFCGIGIILVAVGVSIEVTANVITLAGEGFILAVCKICPIKFGTMKVGFDVSLVVISCILSALFLHGIYGVREGTVAAAILVGSISRQINKYLERKFV